MWAIMKSPLLIGTDIRLLDAGALSIYANPAVIAINQDPAGISVRGFGDTIFRMLISMARERFRCGRVLFTMATRWLHF